MIEISIYRQQIGYFNQYSRCRNNCISKQREYIPIKRFFRKKEEYLPLTKKILCVRLIVVYCLMILVAQFFTPARVNVKVMKTKYVSKLHKIGFQTRILQSNGDDICIRNLANRKPN